MVWFKVDDGFYTSRKVLSIPRRHRLAAVGLWTMAGNWSGRELTDGKVPTYVLEELGATETLIRALVDARLWLDHRSVEARPDLDRASTGIEFTNWAEYQPTRAEVEVDRAKSAERQRKWRERHKGETPDSAVSNGVTNGVTNGVSNDAPTRPDPTRPSISNEIEKEPLSPDESDDAEMIPADWRPNQSHIDKAASLHLDVVQEYQRFRAHADREHRRLKNWNAGFTNWLRKQAEFAQKRQGTTPRPPQQSKAARNAAEYQRIFGGDHERSGSIPAIDAGIRA